MEVKRSLDSAQAIHDKVISQASEVRFTHYVQVEGEFERKLETEISRLEAAEHLKEMRNKHFAVKHVMNDDNRFLDNELMHLNSFIVLAEDSDYIKLYNLIKIEHENGAIKYSIQYQLQDTILTFMIIEQTAPKEVTAADSRKVAV